MTINHWLCLVPLKMFFSFLFVYNDGTLTCSCNEIKNNSTLNTTLNPFTCLSYAHWSDGAEGVRLFIAGQCFKEKHQKERLY